MNKKALLSAPLSRLIAGAALLGTATAAQAQAENPAQSSAWHNAQQAALHSPSAEDGWYRLDGGVLFRRIAGDAAGPAPTVRDVVSVNYTGSFVDGQVFDSNAGKDPVTFPLSRLIRAWQVAIPFMGTGDTAEMIVPMEMGYGPRGGGPIPGGATLKFTIELVEVMQAPG